MFKNKEESVFIFSFIYSALVFSCPLTVRKVKAVYLNVTKQERMSSRVRKDKPHCNNLHNLHFTAIVLEYPYKYAKKPSRKSIINILAKTPKIVKT